MAQYCPYCGSDIIRRVVGEAYSIKNPVKHIFSGPSGILGYAQTARAFQCERCRKYLWLILVTSVKDCPAPVGNEQVYGEYITAPYDAISKEDMANERSLNLEIH